ncbi:MAG TPA: hypothetical protein VGL13_15870, partial [Polyangiaceae bacterium]
MKAYIPEPKPELKQESKPEAKPERKQEPIASERFDSEPPTDPRPKKAPPPLPAPTTSARAERDADAINSVNAANTASPAAARFSTRVTPVAPAIPAAAAPIAPVIPSPPAIPVARAAIAAPPPKSAARNAPSSIPDFSLDFTRDTPSTLRTDVVMLADNELIEEEPSPPASPGPVPLLGALSMDLAAASAESPNMGAMRPSLIRMFGARPEDTRPKLGGKKLWIAAAVAGVAVCAGALLLRGGTTSKKESSEAKSPTQVVASPGQASTSKLSPTPLPAPAPIEPAKVDEHRDNHQEPQAVPPGSPMLAAVPPGSPLAAAVPPGTPMPEATAVAPGAAPDNNDVARPAEPAHPATQHSTSESGDTVRAPSTPQHHPAAPQPAAQAAAPAEPAAAPEPAPPPRPPAPAPPDSPLGPAFSGVDVAPPFDQGVAMQALRDASDGARSCKSGDSPAGPVRIAVTFAHAGNVAQVSVEDAALAATPVGA